MSAGSRLDHVYRNILKTKFFTKGWGSSENLKRLFAFRKVVSSRESCFKLVPVNYPISVIKDETDGDIRIVEGKFQSPFIQYMPGILPKEVETAYFQAVLPAKWHSDHYKPVCIHLAGTGDHGYWRRRQIMAKPLIREAGIGALLLENPFYGQRKPKDQVRSSLHNVSDIFVMGGCLILESLALLHWCENNGFGPLGLTGISMGGHMASLAATNWPKPIVLVPCLSWSTASAVFTDGVMSQGINWELLESQYISDGVYREEIKKMMNMREDAFRAGQHFAKHYPKSMERVNELKEESQKVTTSAYDNCKTEKSLDISSVTSNYLTIPSSNEKSLKLECQNETSDKMVVQCSSSSGTFIVNKQDCVVGSEVQTVVSEGKIDLSELNRIGPKSVNNLPNISSRNSVTSSTQDSCMALSNKSHTLSTNKIMAQLSELKLLEFPWKKENQEEKNKGSSRNGKRKGEYEALQFMRGIMDECTHLRNFDVPVDTSLIIAVCARDDAYVPRDGCTHLSDIWSDVEIRYVDGGHVSAYLLYQNIFRTAIKDSFERLKTRYYAT